MKKSFLLVLSLCGLFLLSACGGGGSTMPNAPTPPMIIANAQPPAGTVGTTYPGFTFTATGGVPPLTWSETGALPPGLMFSSGGLLSGTPTSAGSFLITVMVRDSLGQNATPQDFTIQVALSGQVSGFTRAGSMETARSGHTATFLTAGKVLVTGGVNNNKNILATAELFDPTSGSFAATGSMTTPRQSHTATLLSNGALLITGGADASGKPLATAELSDPSGGSFAATGSMTTARERHTATLLNDGKVLVTGGLDASGNTLTTAELFDPARGTFTATGSMADARSGHTATLLNDGKVLVTGGSNGSPNTFATATAELFDPARGAFTATGSMADARSAHTATLLNNGKVLVTGGVDASDNTLSTAEIFDPASGTFTPTGSISAPREAHTATLLKDGKVLVAGGAKLVAAAVCGNNCVTQVPLSVATADLFDPASGTFTPTGSLGTDRFGHTATLLNDGRVLVTGGVHSTVLGRQFVSTVLSTAELFQ